MTRTAEAAEVAKALGLSPDSIGRYAREGRIPFDTTPGGHRRFHVGEVRQALDLDDASGGPEIFGVPAATRRRRALRSVATPPTTSTSDDLSEAAPIASGADELLASAWRVQRSVPLLPA